MSENRRLATCSAQDVFDVLADGWSFAAWVVGAARVRSVDPSWPAEGSRIHHSFGLWPAVIDDVTVVLRSEPPHRLVLRARGWPVGEATVDLTLEDLATGCSVVLRERAVSGPGSWLPTHVEDAALHVRNSEALRRLVLIAEGRARVPLG